jgi:hypothetical protein
MSRSTANWRDLQATQDEMNHLIARNHMINNARKRKEQLRKLHEMTLIDRDFDAEESFNALVRLWDEDNG